MGYGPGFWIYHDFRLRKIIVINLGGFTVSETNNFKWYVLRAFSGKESKVKEYIEADIKNSDLGQFVTQVVIPTEKKINS